MKKFFIILAVPILVIIVFFVYKTGVLLYYRDLNRYSYNFSSYKVKEKKVTVDKSFSNTKFKNLNIYVPEEFKRIKDDYGYRYVLKDEDRSNYTNMITIGKSYNCFEFLYGEDKRIQTMNYEKLLKMKKIDSEKKLIKYYFANKDKHNNIFTKNDDIKMNYLSRICVANSSLAGKDSKNFYLEGDVNGILNYDDDSYSIKVFDKDKNGYYYIWIFKYLSQENYQEVLTDEVVDKIISSIYFG